MSSEVKRFMAPTNDTCDMDSYQMVILESDYAALEAENARLNDLISAARRVTGAVIEDRDALRAELAEVKGREVYAYAVSSKNAPMVDKVIRRLDVAQEYAAAKSAVWGDVVITPLYTAPPASPDVEGLVKALEEVRGYTDSPHVVGVIDTALSTWRQAHTPSTLPASSAEE